MKLFKLFKLSDEELIDINKYKSYLKKTMIYVIVFIIILIILRLMKSYWPKFLTTKIKNKFIFNYILPLIGTVIFGMIESLSFFIFEDTYLQFLNTFTHDVIISSLMLGSLSSFIAIYFGRNMHHVMELIITQKIEPSPLQEGIGILLGTAIVIIGYIIYEIINKKNDEDLEIIFKKQLKNN